MKMAAILGLLILSSFSVKAISPEDLLGFTIESDQRQCTLESVQDADMMHSFIDMKCVEWVYRGSASREESVRACKGVMSMDCVEWVYRGSASREESARACKGVRSMECVEWVYKGSANREESARACSELDCF